MLGRIEIMLLKACVVFFLIISGSALISVCMSKTVNDKGETMRAFAENYFGFDVMPLGIAGIITGSILMAVIDHHEWKRGIS